MEPKKEYETEAPLGIERISGLYVREDGSTYARDRIYVKLAVSFRDHMLAELKGPKLSVYICLALHCGDKMEAWPSLTLIEKETGYSRTAVIAALGELELLGLLKKEARKQKNGSNSSNLYHVRGHAHMGRGSTPSLPPLVHLVDQGSTPSVPEEEPIEEEPIKEDKEPRAENALGGAQADQIFVDEAARIDFARLLKADLGKADTGGALNEAGLPVTAEAHVDDLPDTPPPQPFIMDVEIEQASEGQFSCPVCDRRMHYKELDRRRSECVRCGQRLRVILEGDYGRKILCEPKQGSIKATPFLQYKSAKGTAALPCASQREYKEARKRLRENPERFTEQLDYFVELWKKRKCAEVEIVAKAIRGYDRVARQEMPAREVVPEGTHGWSTSTHFDFMEDD